MANDLYCVLMQVYSSLLNTFVINSVIIENELNIWSYCMKLREASF